MIRGIAFAARPVRYLNRLARTGRAILSFASFRCRWGQSRPVSPGGPWHSSEEQRIVTEARRFGSPLARMDPERLYSLAELIDLAEANNPEMRSLKVVTAGGWFAARPSGTEDIYKIYAESFQGEAHLTSIVGEAREIVGRALESAA
jgi:hypothetical protein